MVCTCSGTSGWSFRGDNLSQWDLTDWLRWLPEEPQTEWTGKLQFFYCFISVMQHARTKLLSPFDIFPQIYLCRPPLRGVDILFYCG